jgi:hypothetical protein
MAGTRDLPKSETLPDPLARATAAWLADPEKGAADLAATEALCDRLFQAQAWESLLAVSERAIESVVEEATPRLARFLVRSAEAVGDEPRLRAALEAAHVMLPKDPTLALRYAQAL